MTTCEKMKSKENYWENCKRTTGAHIGREGKKTAAAIGRDGAWTLKARGEHKILVGYLVRANSDFSGRSIRDEKGAPARHIAVCEHGKILGGKSTRRKAIDLAKHEPRNCASCRKVSTDAAAL